MIKPKAPKDMMAEEFINFAQERYESTPKNAGSDGMLSSVYMFELLREYLTLSAMNPCTPDELAWMRVEQKDGWNYAAMDWNKSVYLYIKKPKRHGDNWQAEKCGEHKLMDNRFLSNCLNRGDQEPLCFADYAPLNNESAVL